MRTLIIALILAAACSSPPAVQRHALDSADMAVLPIGSPCNSADCGWFTPDGATCAPGTDSCNWACPLCGFGNICIDSGDGTTTCQVACGANFVCGVNQACSMGGDCLDQCLVGGVPYVPPVTDCAGAGLVTGQDGHCIVPCGFLVCALVGGGC